MKFVKPEKKSKICPMLHMRLTASEKNMITFISNKYGITTGEAVRQMINQAYEEEVKV